MKPGTLLIAAVALLAVLGSVTASASVYVNSATVTEFTKFKRTYNKQYESAAEELKRMRIFEENQRIAMMQEAANPKAHFGVTQFSDLTYAEFKSMYANSKAHYAAARKNKKLHKSKMSKRIRISNSVDSIDWRTKGLVTEIKDQGQCGSCWAFSAIGNIEGQWAMAGNDLVNMSEQQLVSCDKKDSGCNGGLMEYAYDWLIENRDGNTVTMESYPYTSGNGYDGRCADSKKTIAGTIVDYEFVESDEDVMADWVAQNGPLAIAVDATSFQTYKGGVLTDCTSDDIDHGVMIVGYDNTFDPPYWTIKNSWGKSWGEQGYIRVEKGTNQCLITEYPISAIV